MLIEGRFRCVLENGLGCAYPRFWKVSASSFIRRSPKRSAVKSEIGRADPTVSESLRLGNRGGRYTRVRPRVLPYRTMFLVLSLLLSRENELNRRSRVDPPDGWSIIHEDFVEVLDRLC